MRPPCTPSRAASIFAVLILCASTCVSQTPQEREASAPPTGLALETNTKEGPVGHTSVPGRFFGGRYRRLPDWHPPAGAKPPRTFKLMNDPEGDAVRVRVFAVMDRFHEQDVLLGDYLLREGEKAVVESMRTYGYEPMEVTVVRVRREPARLPVAMSSAPSVVVIGVEEKQTNFPSYKVTLRNLSNTDITRLEVHTFKGGRRSAVHWPRVEQNRPLLKAGGVYELSVMGGGRGRQTPEGYTPSAPDSVEVISAVFADGSYEGERRSALNYIVGLRGQRMQLVRALALLGGAGQWADARAALDDLGRRVQALDRQAPAAVEDLPAPIPGFTQRDYEGMRVDVEGGLDQVRKELLKDIEEYRQARDRPHGSQPFGAWLGDLRKKYEAWLSRL